MHIPQKLKPEILFDPAAVLNIFSKKLTISDHSKTCTTMFIITQFITSKSWQQNNCFSTDDGSRKCGFQSSEILLFH